MVFYFPCPELEQIIFSFLYLLMSPMTKSCLILLLNVGSPVLKLTLIHSTLTLEKR